MRIVLPGRDGTHRVAVAVRALEDLAGNLGPARGLTGTGAVVHAVGCPRIGQVEDGAGHLVREGEPADLVVDDRNLG